MGGGDPRADRHPLPRASLLGVPITSEWAAEGRRAVGVSRLTWNFFLATKYCMRRMTLMVARWCSRSLWGRGGVSAP